VFARSPTRSPLPTLVLSVSRALVVRSMMRWFRWLVERDMEILAMGAVDLDDQSPTDEADFATQSLDEALVAVEKKIKAKGKGKGGV
jgi:hypothetical protein